jgi:integrase
LALDALRDHLDTYAGDVWLFQSSVNDVMSIHRATLHITYWKPLLKAAGLPIETRFCDLRHTAASLLLGEGVAIPVVSQILGHADSSITLKIYAHVLPDMQNGAADAMDDALV